MTTQRALSLKAPVLISALAVTLMGCITTSDKQAQEKPKYVATSLRSADEIKSCIVAPAPELYTVVSRESGWRIINAGTLGAVFVLDVIPSPTGSSVKGYAPGLFPKGRVDRCI